MKVATLTASPLCQESDLQVYRPDLGFFIEKIRQNEYFSFTRQMHGPWDAVIAAWILKPELRHIRLSDNNYVQQLAMAMSEAKNTIEGLFYEPGFYVELIEILRHLNAEDSSFMFGVSDTYFYPDSPPPYSIKDFWLPDKCVLKLLSADDHLNFYKIRFEDRQNVIKRLLPPNYPFFDAMLWKLYAYRNEIWDLFKSIKNHPVVLVGPPYYEDFGQRGRFTNYHHIKIHGSRASTDRETILDQIIRKHQTLSQESKPPIYFFVAGSVAVYWVYHLHQKIENKFLIDVGQAFNYLYESKSALMHREFGYSQKAQKGRRTYHTKQLYGKRSFHSSMRIENDVVLFELQLKLQEYWLEKLITIISKRLINLYTIKRQLFKIRHNFYKFLHSRPYIKE